MGIFIGIAGCFWYTAYKQWEAQQAKKGNMIKIQVDYLNTPLARGLANS